MVQGIDNAIQLFREAEMPYWKLYEGFESKPSNAIAESSGSDSQTDLTSAEKKLEQILRMQQPGKYLLSVREKFNSNQSGVNIRLEIPWANGMMPAISGIGSSATPPIGYVHKSEMELALVKQSNDFEIKNLRREFEEFTKKKEPKQTAFDSFLEKHGAVLIGALMSRFAPGAQVGLQGFSEQTADSRQQTQDTRQQPATADEKLTWVIDTLSAKEGSQDAAVELLYRFTHFVQQNPAQYDAFKPMILNTEIKHG